jgi:hypothetical protein
VKSVIIKEYLSFNSTFQIRMPRNTRAAVKALEAGQRIDGHTSLSPEGASQPVETEVDAGSDPAVEHNEKTESTKSKGKKKRVKKGKNAKVQDEPNVGTNETEDASVDPDAKLSEKRVNGKHDELNQEIVIQSSRGKNVAGSRSLGVARQTLVCLFV